MNDPELKGRTAFVSGSGRNIGRAVAVRLAKMGCNVIVNGSSDESACRETAELVAGTGVESLVAMGDVGRADHVEDVARQALRRFGVIDVLVNNAARRPHKPFLETTDEDWSVAVDAALAGTFRLSRAFLPGMIGNGWGRIVNFAGMKSIRGYFEGAPISAAKHGVWGLTKALSIEFAGQGVTVNVVSPGQVRDDAADGDDPARSATIPVGFMGLPDDIASTVAFLASPQARFVTGQMIAVNGGEAT